MNCEHPINLYRRPGINPATGKLYPLVTLEYVKRKSGLMLFQEASAPCGKCFSCLKDKARDLTFRAWHEAKMHKHNCFVTLTVDDEHMAEVFPGENLDHRPFQLFMKRLRKSSGLNLRYLMCGEYGETTARPHYHVILFGLRPDERRPVAIVKTDPLLGTDRALYSGFNRSKVIEDAWPYGHVYIGSCSPGSIAYCAGYTMKAYTLGRDEKWYKDRYLTPEYIKWSRRPGLGHTWLEANFDDLWRNGCDMFEPDLVDNSAPFNGHSMSLPRAYRARLDYLNKKYLAEPDPEKVFSISPLQLSRKLDNISVSLSRQLVLAEEETACKRVSDLLEASQVLKNRRDKQFYDVARRKRL